MKSNLCKGLIALLLVFAFLAGGSKYFDVNHGFVNAEEHNRPTPTDDPNLADEPLAHAAPVVDTTGAGANIKRTMGLLASGTPENRSAIKIAVYGQSISDGNNRWPSYLIAALRNRYPNTDIIFENLAVGGFATGSLKKTVENDMRSFYPDLVILQDYGDANEYEEIVRWIRQNTVSEIILQTEHYSKNDDLNDNGSNSMSGYIKAFAKKYKCEIADVRRYWREYLVQNSVPREDLLSDDVHLNLQGQALMYEIIKQYFITVPVPVPYSTDDNVTYVQVTKEDWTDGRLRIPFKGNRIEAVLGGDDTYMADVLINGKKPSMDYNLYSYKRIYGDGGFWTSAGGFLKADILKVPLEQNWTITFSDVKGDRNYKYQLSGSVTGNDGTGTSTKKFISRSGAFAFDPGDRFQGYGGLKNGDSYQFSSFLMGTDTLTNGNEGQRVLLGSNMISSNNELVLKAANPSEIPNIKGIRIYRQGFAVSALKTPVIPYLTNKSNYFIGRGQKDGVAVLYKDKKYYRANIDPDGYYMFEDLKLTVGEKLTVFIKNYGETSKSSSCTVKPALPTVRTIKSNSRVISGKTLPRAKVKIKYPKKTRIVRANSKGEFRLKLLKPLKKKTKVTFVVSVGNYSSKVKTVKVK